jgi:type III pantothenate kinase
MQGLITIDFGNTNPHAGLFKKNKNGWKLITVTPWERLTQQLAEHQLSADNSSMILSEVKPREDELMPYLQQGYLLNRIKDYWKGSSFAGMPVNYAHTIGEDRLIQAFYIFKKIKESVLLIDAGTYLTLDIIDQQGFKGGYIVPGIQKYFDSFQQGEFIKAVSLDHNFNDQLPHSTKEAMRDSYLAFAALVQKLVKDHKIQKILVTGGQGVIWKNLLSDLESTVSVQLEDDLIHWAMHYWMTTQIELL